MPRRLRVLGNAAPGGCGLEHAETLRNQSTIRPRCWYTGTQTVRGLCLFVFDSGREVTFPPFTPACARAIPRPATTTHTTKSHTQNPQSQTQNPQSQTACPLGV
eukprot:2496502-Rhodomonas_salina.1